MNQENNTFFVGKVLQNYQELTSTNQFALNLLATSKPIEGTVISTHTQTGGRGQAGNTWESAAGMNLTLSIILYPTFLLARHQFLLNQAVSLGVLDSLRPFLDAGLSVKWSNDIYIFNKKLAGILIQNTLSGAYMQSSVVGIGLNVNQTEFLSDAPNPSSLALETQNLFHLSEIRQSLFYHIEKWYLHLRASKYDLIRSTYLDNLYLLNKKARFERPNGQQFEGMISGIHPTGKLIIYHGNELEAFGFKEVKFIV